MEIYLLASAKRDFFWKPTISGISGAIESQFVTKKLNNFNGLILKSNNVLQICEIINCNLEDEGNQQH